ncbi:MAG: HugZ family protein [Candidatus Rokuibacteriota bacterium]
MSSHAGPPPDSDTPPVPEPSFAERARTLAAQVRTGTLATLSRQHPGHPFASLMPYALDADGRPLLLISTMAVHTQNLLADPRASLLVTQPDVSGEPLAGGRLTLMGEARALGDDETVLVRAAYLARHPMAGSWVDFGDFGFWRLEVRNVYFVGGFAAMGWVDAAGYRAARPDPLADVAAGIVEHMNRDHADALRLYAGFFAGAESDEASMTSVDRLGFKLRLRRGPRHWSARVPFPREVTTAAEARTVLIEMLRQARGS